MPAAWPSARRANSVALSTVASPGMLQFYGRQVGVRPRFSSSPRGGGLDLLPQVARDLVPVEGLLIVARDARNAAIVDVAQPLRGRAVAAPGECAIDLDCAARVARFHRLRPLEEIP